MKLLIPLSVLLTPVMSLNILAVLHHSMKSHYTIGSSILESLLNAGHNVTAITHHQTEKSSDNYRTVYIPDIMELMKIPNGTPFDFVNMPLLIGSFYIPFMSHAITAAVLNSTELHEFLQKDEKFDICIMELFLGEALLGIAEKSGCSVIQYTTFDAALWSDNILGNVSPSSYFPHPFLYYNDQMSFKQRLWNTAFTLIENFNYKIVSLNLQKRLYQKYFTHASRTFEDMYGNTSLIFINSHVSSSFIRPHMPTQIEIGGIHVKPAKPLPDDIQSFLDEATDGVIFFSMGSYIDGTDWKIEHREAFLKAFGKLKQKVMWRYSNETLPGNPGNIKIGSWFPQRDILAHSNVKVFITHGGLLGTTEAIVEGVPVLGIPVFGDQLMNMAKTVARGYGLQVLVHDVTEESISNALNELLTNPVYKENAVIISKRFNDRPRTPQQEVVYWTEYVARHQGAQHLQAFSVNQNFIEFYSYDVYSVIFLILLIILYVEFKILKLITRKIFCNSKSNSKKKVQ